MDTDLETIQREAQLRRLGRDLHDQAAADSPESVECVAAVVTRLAAATDYGDLVREGFAEAMVIGAAASHMAREGSPATPE